MSAITENAIKQIMLGFLKSYYRNRPRHPGQSTLAQLDLRGEGGIITDGLLRFQLPDGRYFLAPFEATSYETREEILFRTRVSYVLWDTAALLALLFALTMALAHGWLHWYPLLYWPYPGSAALIFGMLLLCFGLIALVLHRMPRYRTIYAIEQFRQYPADERWIAFGYDVFITKKDPYYRHLIKECTRYGIGLVEISANRVPHLIIAAGREANFQPRQMLLKLLPVQQWNERMRRITPSRLKTWWKQIKDSLSEQFQPFRSQYFRWFPRSYYNQWALIFIGAVAGFYMLRQEYLRLPLYRPNEAAYKAALAEKAAGLRPETDYVLIDAPMPGFYDSTFSLYSELAPEELFAKVIQGEGSTHPDSVLLPPVRIVAAEPGQEPALYYSCTRLQRQGGAAFYLLVDTLYPTLSQARDRLQFFNELGMRANATWGRCLNMDTDAFLVFVDDLLVDTVGIKPLVDSLGMMVDSNYYFTVRRIE